MCYLHPYIFVGNYWRTYVAPKCATPTNQFFIEFMVFFFSEKNWENIGLAPTGNFRSDPRLTLHKKTHRKKAKATRPDAFYSLPIEIHNFLSFQCVYFGN